MNKDSLLVRIDIIEKMIGMPLPNKYKQFLSENVKNSDAYEIYSGQDKSIYIYSSKDLIERNETYGIRDIDPDYLLIGQDGNLGYFINVRNSSDNIYSLDLGALGSQDMDEEAINIYDLEK